MSLLAVFIVKAAGLGLSESFLIRLEKKIKWLSSSLASISVLKLWSKLNRLF